MFGEEALRRHADRSEAQSHAVARDDDLGRESFLPAAWNLIAPTIFSLVLAVNSFLSTPVSSLAAAPLSLSVSVWPCVFVPSNT